MRRDEENDYGQTAGRRYREGYGDWDRDRGRRRDGAGIFTRMKEWIMGQKRDDDRDERSGWRRDERLIGRGPRGYQRSDERIREDVCDRLCEGYLDASEIEVRVNDGVVTLIGKLDDRRDKRIAESLAESVQGVKDVDNQLRINRDRDNGEDMRRGARPGTIRPGTTSPS
jgi:hypothetical protein